MGAFASLDLFFFYAFHELALIPTFLLIGIWGSGNRQAAAWKITIYLATGSFILLLGLIMLYRSVPEAARSFDFRDLAKSGRATIPADAQGNIFLLLLIGFGILVSLFPVSHLGAGSLRLRARARGDAARRRAQEIRTLRSAASGASAPAGRRASNGTRC